MWQLNAACINQLTMTKIDNGILKQLFEEIAQDNKRAFELFYNMTLKWVWGTYFKKTRCQEKAKELTQTFYVLLWEKRSRLPDAENPAAYINTIIQRQEINSYRKEQLVKIHMQIYKGLMPQEDRNFTMDTVDARQLTRLLQKALLKMPDSQNLTFQLRYLYQHSYEQIAALMNLTTPSCHTYHWQALQRLRGHLQHY